MITRSDRHNLFLFISLSEIAAWRPPHALQDVVDVDAAIRSGLKSDGIHFSFHSIFVHSNLGKE